MALARASQPIPTPAGPVAWRAARAFVSGGALAALAAIHTELGDIFALPLPGFRAVALAGPEANQLVLTEARERLLWRSESDPVTRLLGHGVLVTDGAQHDELRAAISPALHHSLFERFTQATWRGVDRVTATWRDGARVRLTAESRRLALLILMDALYGEDFTPHMRDLWIPIERSLRYISPGLWLVWPGLPRPGYAGALDGLDTYFRQLIAQRRARPGRPSDLPDLLISAGLSDDLIRDQLFTMFIAGHDTSAALIAWSLALLASHPKALTQAHAEVDAALAGADPTAAHLRQAPYLDRVIKEALRLYPPIHLGSRIAAADIAFREFVIPARTRVLYSIYLAHRDPRYWPDAEVFDPDRFTPGAASGRPAFTYVPFGGGPRNCIGAQFAQLEARIAVARLLQRYTFSPTGALPRPRMRATLEPPPGAEFIVHLRQPLA